jgi:hypothetical protein
VAKVPEAVGAPCDHSRHAPRSCGLMERATFNDRITGSNSSGAIRFVSGPSVAYCDVIPEDAPQDWEMGPKMTPGEFGIFLEHLWHPRGHSPYAVATGKTPEEAKLKASGLFRGQITGWVVV